MQNRRNQRSMHLNGWRIVPTTEDGYIRSALQRTRIEELELRLGQRTDRLKGVSWPVFMDESEEVFGWL